MTNNGNNVSKLETFDIDKIADIIFSNLLKETKPYNKWNQYKQIYESEDCKSVYCNEFIEIANNISLSLYYNSNTHFGSFSPFRINIICNGIRLYCASFSKFKDKLNPTKEEFANCLKKVKKKSLNRVNKKELDLLYELVKAKKVKLKVRKYIFEAK